MAPRSARRLEFPFVLDALAEIETSTRLMFGCTAIYAREQIVLILRDKEGADDNGVWVATTVEHHESLRRDLPSLQSISIFGPPPTGWQNIPADSPTFEQEVLRACELVLQRDPRIGKTPAKKKPRLAPKVTAKKKAPAKRASRSR